MVGKRKGSKPSEVPAKKAKLSSVGGTADTRKKTKTFGFGSPAGVTLDEGEVEPFPRGGQESLTPLEKRVIHQQAKQELLFKEIEVVGKDKSKRSKKRPKSATAQLEKSQGTKQKTRLNIMNQKKLYPGTLILGAVLEVHEYEVIFSLPFNMRGSVAISDVSDTLTRRLETEAERLEIVGEEIDESSSAGSPPSLDNLFTKGQLMPCYVSATEGVRISLSVNPRLINTHLTTKDIRPGMILPGFVKSIEDHGYIMDFALEGKTGFLLKKNAAEFIKRQGRGKSLCLGQVVKCLVLPGADARAVPVSINPSQVGGALLSGDTFIGINALLPGLLVNAAVKEVGSNGLLMSFLGGFEGTVSSRHLPVVGELSTDSYHPKKKFKGRILWVDLATKSAGLTLQKQIVSGDSFSFQDVEIGDIFQVAKVVLVDPSSALYLELGNDIIGYAPAWKITDEKRDKAVARTTTKTLYCKGSHHPCRVIQFNLLDGVAIVSLQPSVLEKPYMKYSDLNVGEIVEGSVERFGDFGMIVTVTDTIRGLCPRLHLSDVRAIMKQPRKKYKEGSKVKCRVLNLVPSQKQLLLSCKKSLVRSTTEPLTSYTQAVPGGIHQGVITSVHSYGCIVHFYNRVRGLILKSELSSTHPVLDPTMMFWVGQPVECRVLNCDPSNEKLLLSFKLDTATAVSVSQEDALTACSFVDGEVTGIASNGINLRYPKTGEVLFLPTFHLSDYPSLCSHLLNYHQTHFETAVKEGEPYLLPDLLVLSGKVSYKPALVTLKKTLHRHARGIGFVTDFTDIKVGKVQPGVVKKIMAYGCFIDFPHQLCGLAPTKYLTNEFISSPSGLYQEMQTVWSKVMEVDDTNGRFLLSLRPSDLKLSPALDEQETNEKLVSSFLEFICERNTILSDLTPRKVTREGSLSVLAKSYCPGERASGHVTSIAGDHVTMEMEGGVVGKASLLTANEVKVQKGDEVICVILDIDLVDCCLVVSLNPKLTNPGESSGRVLRSSSKKKEAKTSVPVGPSGSLKATVEYKTPYYFLLSYTTVTGTGLAYGVMDTGQLGVLPTNFKDLKLGQQISTTTLSPSAEKGSPLPILQMTGPPSTDTRGVGSSREGRCGSLYSVKPGDIISVEVHSVKPTQLDVKYNLQRGRVHCTFSENAEKDGCHGDDVTMMSPRKGGRQVFRDVKARDTLRARVVKIKERQIQGQVSKKGATIDVLELTTKPSLLDPAVELDADSVLRKTYPVGDEVTGVIWQVKDRGLSVYLNPRAEGFVPRMLITKTPDSLLSLKRLYAEGQAVRCTIVGSTKEGSKKHIHNLSMIGPVSEPCEGDIVTGRVKQVLPGHALLVSTPHGTGRVDITNISDTFVEDPLKQMKTSSFLRCYVLSMADGKLDLSLRASRTGCVVESNDSNKEEDEVTDQEVESLGDITKGQVLRGYVKAVTDVGVFVRLGRNIDGRVKITHLIDGFIKDFKKHFTVGKLVTTKVLNVDAAHGKVDLSLRLSHVNPEAAKKLRKKQEIIKAQKEKDKKKTRKRIKALTSDGESNELESVESSSEDELSVATDSDSDGNDLEEMASDEENTSESSKMVDEQTEKKPTLRLSGGFHWDVGVACDKEGVVGGQSDASSSESEEEEMELAPKKSRRQKKAALKAEEAHLYQTEEALLDQKRAPESADDFDRLLVASPNDSSLWVQYMAFYLHTTEVDKARSVAQRALKTIVFREEKEKLNVWVAWMNLENLYGSQESLVKVFDMALKENEPIEVFSRLVAIYEQTKKSDLADQLYQVMTKRFSTIPRVWSQYGGFLMKRGKKEAARSLLQRSLKSLVSKQQHVDIISKFAQLEFKDGEPERGKTMFESLLSSYPRRIDLWSVYIDMMIKLGESKPVRDILERAIHLKLSAKKMKFLFKRYLEFEKKYGSMASMEAVKEKAKAYVESKASQ